jgi:predicted dehydrogenase
MYLQPYNIMPEGLEIGGITTSGRQICAYQDERLGVGGLGDPFTFLDLDMKSDNEGFGHIGCQEQRRDFLRCLRDRTRKPIANGQVGRESLQVALAAERSIREGRPINVSELEACSV